MTTINQLSRLDICRAPAGALQISNGTILLPPAPKDNDSLIISTTRNLTNVSIRSTVVNVPFGNGTIAGNSALVVKYNAQLNNWFIAG